MFDKVYVLSTPSGARESLLIFLACLIGGLRFQIELEILFRGYCGMMN